MPGMSESHLEEHPASSPWIYEGKPSPSTKVFHKVTCLESRYKAVPVFSLLRHIGDAPVHWHEETSSCGDILPVEESARQYQCWQAISTFLWSPDKWYPAVFPEAKGCADDLHRTIWASFHGDSFEFRNCPFRSDASANDISKTIYRTGVYRKALCQFLYADALIVSFQNQLSSFVVQHSTHLLWLCYITFSQKLKCSLLYYWKLLYIKVNAPQLAGGYRSWFRAVHVGHWYPFYWVYVL